MDKQSLTDSAFNKQFWSAVVIFAIIMWFATENKEDVFIFTIFFMMVLPITWAYLGGNDKD